MRSTAPHQVRSAATHIPASAIDPRNPFDVHGRMYAYFEAFLEGNGRTSFGQLLQKCLEINEQFGIEDADTMIRRDLINQVHQWRNGHWGLTVATDDTPAKRGASGRLHCGEIDNVIYEVTHIKGKSWKKFLAELTPGQRMWKMPVDSTCRCPFANATIIIIQQ